MVMLFSENFEEYFIPKLRIFWDLGSSVVLVMELPYQYRMA